MATQSFRELLGIRPSTASPTDSALLIIDAQNEYASGALTVTNAAASGKVIADLLAKYRKADGKIVHVLHKVPDGAPIFTPGTDLAEEFKELKAEVCFLLVPVHSLRTEADGYRPARRPSGSNTRDRLSKRLYKRRLRAGVSRRLCSLATWPMYASRPRHVRRCRRGTKLF